MRTRRLATYVTVALAFGLLWALTGGHGGAVHAKTTINVTTTNDEMVNDGNCSLREALLAANTDTAVDACPAGSGADTIDLPAGTYILTITGTNEDGGLTGDLDITSAIDIAGANASQTIVDGNATDRVFDVLLGAQATLSNLTIRNGRGGAFQFGGGIHNVGNLTLIHSIVVGNSAPSGGGIHNDLVVGGSGTLTLEDDLITQNESGSLGGGIVNHGIAVVNNTTIQENRAGTYGGGIYSDNPLTLTNSTLSGNLAEIGGGIANDIGILQIRNATISGNTATNAGGGMYNSNQVRMNNVTLANNTASTVAAILSEPKTPVFITQIANTILAGNTATADQTACNGTLTSQGYNLLQETAGCTIVGDSAGNLLGINPLLSPLQNNGGSTFTLAPRPGSPVIDAGNPEAPGSSASACETTDQRGVTRPQDGNGDGIARCDIGALEVLSAGVLSVSIDIKPGDTTNSINLKSKGVIPVAILSTATFDARSVIPSSVKFGPNGATSARNSYEDVNGDGLLDLVLHFRTQATGIQPGDTQACLVGKMQNGTSIRGCDSIHIVP